MRYDRRAGEEEEVEASVVASHTRHSTHNPNPNLMALLVMLSQKQHIEKLKFSENLECHVLEVSDKGRWHRWPPE